MRRVGIDDTRLFLLGGNPYALFAGVAPVGQDTALPLSEPSTQTSCRNNHANIGSIFAHLNFQRMQNQRQESL